MAPRNFTGSFPDLSHLTASTDAKRSCVSGCQDQRRLPASSPSACSGSGRTGRTVNRRIALTRDTLTQIDLNDPIVGKIGFGPGWTTGFRVSQSSVCSGHGRTHPSHGRLPCGRVRPLPGEGCRGRGLPRHSNDLQRGARRAERGPGGHRARREATAAGPDEQGRHRARHLARELHPRRGRPVDLRDRVVERPGRHLAAQRRDQDPGRHRRRPDVRRGRAAARAPRRRAARSAAPSARPSPTRSPRCRTRRGPSRSATRRRSRRRSTRCSPSTRCATWSPPPGPTLLRRPRAGAVQRLVRVLPALRGRLRRRQDRQGRLRHAPHGDQAARRGRRDGLRHHLPPPDPPDRAREPQGPQQHARPRPRRHGVPVGDRRRRGRPRHHPPRPGHRAGPDRVRAAGHRARPRGRARPRAPGGARPPLGQEAPRVVHHPRRRLDRLRREPSEEVPGHLPGQLRQRPRGHLRRGAPDRAQVDVVRGADLPGRQPAHQARRVLGVAARRGPQDRPGRAVPRPRRSPSRR